MHQNLIQAPIDSQACPDFPVIQYVDDTILVLPADTMQLWQIKNLILHYTEFTSLKVKYGKSFMVPINVPAQHMNGLLNILGCQQGQFPFTYLGLPLGTSKPKIEDFTPMMAENRKKFIWVCYLFSTALDTPEEERMMQQSSVSISLSFLRTKVSIQ